MRIFILNFLFIIAACSTSPEGSENENEEKLFIRLSAEETGIEFINALEERGDLDVFRYRNFYNGGGVGIGDINNDGLADVYLTSNMGDNKLYLNKGNWKFEDITSHARVRGSKIWSTGISMADVNGDGWLDLYVCNAGDVKGGRRENELFINNGDLTFTESAEKFGLADPGFTTHAAFFDFDKDGDLDCYVLNNSYRPVSSLGYRNLRNERDKLGGHKLFRNDNNFFKDISESARIYGSVIGFGLGVTVGDVNQDSWPDLYIANDFYERDYLYINNHDGTFDEKLEDYMGHISMFSMGADLADINNDGYPEIFSTDMLPEKDERLKTLTSFETYDVYQLRLKNGYHHQFMRNMLHLNNQNGTFSEVGQLAGVAATDWSWGALMADFNNDLYKEIFVCNGIYKDLIDQDFIQFLGNSEQMQAAIEGEKIDFANFVDRMPSQKLSNYLFLRESDLQYKNVAKEWGLDEPSFSNGAAYGDLDNDGDLDLIVNNVNQELFVYRNQSREISSNNYLAFTFKGTDKNAFGLGTSVHAYVDSQVLYFEHMPIRGFQSSMDYKMIIGLGEHELVDSIIITWPDQKRQVLRQIKANQTLIAENIHAEKATAEEPASNRVLLSRIPTDEITHIENSYNDFNHNRLLYHMLSTEGPAFAKADLNNDGFEDIFVGGSSGYPASLYMQGSGYTFQSVGNDLFQADIEAEDVAAEFFDADGDGDLDLYVVTGGSEHLQQSTNNLDRLYENKGLKNGIPHFVKTANRMPPLYQSGSCVKPVDIDNDGDMDLFVGTRLIPSYYGLPCNQVLLLNDGKGVFTDVTDAIAPELRKLGMVTDAVWFDYDGNGFKDVLIIGDWMPITIFLNDGVKLKKSEAIDGLKGTDGWWNRIKGADIDSDGDLDFIIGNLGLNSRIKPTKDSPISLHLNDFDQNGSLDPIFSFKKNGVGYPLALKPEIVEQMSILKKQFVYHRDYAGKSIDDIFDANLLEGAHTLNFNEPHTSVLVNNGLEGFTLKHLPLRAQFSPVYGIEVMDLNSDNHLDIILGGNLFAVKPDIGRYDAMFGLVLSNDGDGNFEPVSPAQSGLVVKGEIRHIATLKSKGKENIAIVRNNDSVLFYKPTQ